MKLLYLSIKGLQLFSEGLEIDFIARQRVTDMNEKGLSRLRKHVYKQNVLGFIGMNASGKTTVLKWIACVLNIYLRQGKLNDKTFEKIFLDEEITVDAYFTDGEYIFKIHSEIIQMADGSYTFQEETLWKKTFVKTISRAEVLKFTQDHVLYERSKEKTLFLSDDISIMISIMKEIKNKPQVMDLLDDTNVNLMRVLGDVPTPIIQYLDHSVEYVKSEISDKRRHIKLKFKGREEEIFVYNSMELFHYLSSGTIKGLNVFAAIRTALETGGFIIIDEIENHFNESIVRTIVDMFKNEKINTMGATLVFSTHYAELLDDFERTDNIYISFKSEILRIEKLSEILNRTDFKKSEVYQSNYIGKTSPSYDAYMGLKRYFIQHQNNKEV